MRVVVPIGKSYVQVGLVGALFLLPVYGLWICWLLVWLPLKWAVLATVSLFRWVFKEGESNGRQA